MWDFMETNMPFFHGGGMFIFWIIILIVVFALIKSINKKEKTPLDILKKRLAKGEISKEEFDKLKKELL